MYGHVLHLTLCLTKLCGGLDLLGSMCIFASYMCSHILQASLKVVEHSTIYWTKPRDTAGVTRHSFNDDTHCDLTAMLGCLAAMEGRLSGAIPLSLTYSNSVYFKGVMNPDALAVLRGVIGLAVHGNVWKCMEMYRLEVRPLHASFLSRWSFSQPERVSLSHGSGSCPAFPSL